MRMLLLIPASLTAHSREVVELLLGLLCLGGAVLVLVAGFWLRFRAVNVTALALSGFSALMFRLLSHTAKLHTVASVLCMAAIAVGVITALRTARAAGPIQSLESDEDGNRLRLRRRKRRPDRQ
jgi:hypothetical protein